MKICDRLLDERKGKEKRSLGSIQGFVIARECNHVSKNARASKLKEIAWRPAIAEKSKF